ncbi:MAG: hypothetical protein V2A57_05490 [Elusimicrobiota bacterium]
MLQSIKTIMANNYLQVKQHNRHGYKPKIDFEKWRVAFLNTLQELTLNKITRLERHMKSDEVFVLLKGEGALVAEGIKKNKSGQIENTYNAYV